METTKVRELGDAELKGEARKSAEKLFRLRFQMKLGQIEGVKNLREIRKGIARIKTIERERTLGVRGAAPLAASALPAKTKKARKEKAGAKETS